MIELRRATERRHLQWGKTDAWLTFCRYERPRPLTDDFGLLSALDEIRLPPGAVSAPHSKKEDEIVTYVFQGAIAQEDSTGGSGIVHAGEFQRSTLGDRVRHKETNASLTNSAHILRICLRPWEAGLGCAHDQKYFATAERRNVLCPVVSVDGRKGSLRLLQDALIYSSVLAPGRHVIHELLPGRSAWIHLVCGEATVRDIILTRGDGIGVTIEPSISLTAQEPTEILLIDLGPAPSRHGDSRRADLSTQSN